MQLAPDVFPRKDQRRVTEAKTSLKKGHRLLSIFIAENFVVACLLPPLNMKLGNLCRSRQLGQKKNVQKSVMLCGVFALLIKLIGSDGGWKRGGGRGGALVGDCLAREL